MIFVKFESQLHFKTSVLFILLFGKRKTKKQNKKKPKGKEYPTKIRGTGNNPGCHLKNYERLYPRQQTWCTRVGAAGLRSPLGATQTSKRKCFILAVAVLAPRQSSLLMLSGPGYAEVRDRAIPEDTIPLQVAVNRSDITQNSPVLCSEAHSHVRTRQPEAAGTLHRDSPWSCGEDLQA